MSDKFDPEELSRLIREALGENADKPFRPCAVYQDSLDTVFVIVRDCSYCQIPVSKVLAIHEDNYPEEGENKYVGFEIWGIRHFYTAYGKQWGGKTNLRELLEDMMTIYPCPQNYRDEIFNLLKQVDTVELPNGLIDNL